MRLARIEHWRCGEPISWKNGGGYSYVWVSEDLTKEELSALCDKAQQSYLDTEQDFKRTAPINPPGYGPTIHSGMPDNMTVGELRRSYEAAEFAYKAYQKQVELARKSFTYWLELHGNGKIKQFHSPQPDTVLNVELSWGHNHGVTVEYGSTAIKDYPFPQEEEIDDL